MLHLLLALHLLFAVFAIGPLVHAATTAGRGVRRGDGLATAASARMLRIYAYVSVLVVVAGGALMSQKEDGRKLAEIGDTWIWLSIALWAVAIAIVLAVIVPTLNKVTLAIERQESVVSRTALVAASGGVVGVIFVVIVALMAYKPGS
jgi:cytochrome bd-type quinol oxidase subunit 2